MASTDPATAIIPIDLGTASAFEQNIFPLEYYEAGDNLSKGSLLLKVTLEEMAKIAQMNIDLNKNDDFIFDTRLGIEALKAERAQILENRRTLNPFKAFRNYRAARMFHAASRALYTQTKRTSEKIRREERPLQVVPSTHMRKVDGAPPSNSRLIGISVELLNGWNDSAERTINAAKQTIVTQATNPFEENSMISQLRDDEHAITLADTASLLSQDMHDPIVDDPNRSSVASGDNPHSPMSPQTVNHIHIFQNSIVTTGSNVTGFTVNHGSGNSGATVTQEFAP